MTNDTVNVKIFFMRPLIPALKIAILWTVLTALVIGAVIHQINFSLKPLPALWNRSAMITRNDTEKLQILAPDLFALVKAVNAFPSKTTFYFVPCFNDSGNTGRWWWYVFLMTRYLSYPRIIFCHSKEQFNNTKEEYLSRFIGPARTWQELDWITTRHIEIIILMRHNTIEFIRAGDPITNL